MCIHVCLCERVCVYTCACLCVRVRARMRVCVRVSPVFALRDVDVGEQTEQRRPSLPAL